MKEKVILLHGYYKKKNDMQVLKENLTKLSYQVILFELPLSFKTIKKAGLIFKNKVQKLKLELAEDEKINFVAHSSGGLVIRNYLAEIEDKSHINRVVLIATPNCGSSLAVKGKKYLPFFTKIFKTLDSIVPTELAKLQLSKGDDIEIGAIAGTKNNLLLGKLLKDANDGRIEVDSVKADFLSDFITLPYGHKEIHYQLETAEAVDCFLQKGKFNC
ncbi:alpha/beta fold hydrolase [Halanaerobium sp. Z-7514]|uniref:Alpha/beta fold hydrolase n=1 Tax=Halanaerobium polyolivorans TaxID=2886943 RepID=A0AAW4WUH8_9FIRM|nr:alpha/beta fold hydrolase [Halanaerobium polyolivorans]MCC3144666.1 alpha/beta fold hydrolase [Halanaerobium polyolivorans]RQD68910.1 MAG: alpha/beta fold hydrolase [Halanaerobium sp. MSAO_Bac5]